jgi:hypothetical protein
MCVRARVDEREQKRGTMMQQQRTVLFKCENLKMEAATQTRVRERERE